MNRLNISVWLFCLVTVYMLFASCKTKSTMQKKIEVTHKADWTRIEPGGGGSTFIPTFSYGSTDDFFIRCDMTGAYLTKDGESNFTQINYPNGLSSFAFNPLNFKTPYIGSRALNRLSDGVIWERGSPLQRSICWRSC